MEQQSPSWLDERFLITVIEGGEDKNSKVSIHDFRSELAVPLGKNYNSLILRVHVNYTSNTSKQEQSLSLIIKTPFTKGLYAEFLEDMDLFGKEQGMYDKVLTKVHEKAGVQFAPKCYLCPLNKGLVLNDLSAHGYIMSEGYKQLDYLHCKQVFINIAKFHASSVSCYHDNPSFITNIGEECLYKETSKMGPLLKTFIESCAKCLAEYVIEITGNRKLADPLVVGKDSLWKSAVNMCRPKEEGLNVLNHGDLWKNNMLFKYNSSQEVVDVKFIDYQVPRFGSPVLDLVFFIWTSAREDVREYYQSDLFTMYLQTLNTTLESLNCDERFSEEEMMRDLKAAKDWALVVICQMLPVVMPPKDIVPMEEISSDDFIGDKHAWNMCRGEHMKTILPGVMRQFGSWDTLSVLK